MNFACHLLKWKAGCNIIDNDLLYNSDGGGLKAEPVALRYFVNIRGIFMFTRDIFIDLGTDNTRVGIRGKGIVAREPSVVAYDVRNDTVKAVGAAAKEMIGRTPGSIVAVKPIKGGVIADFDVTEAMLRKFIKSALRGSLFSRCRVMLCVPSGVTEVESRAIYDAASHAGASEVDLIEVPLAAAIGAGIDVAASSGSMVIDIGGGTTEVAVTALGDIVTAHSTKVAGDSLDEAIINYIRKKHNLLIGERTAEQLKIALGSALEYENEGSMEVKGRNLVDGLPKNIEITAEEVREALSDQLYQIVDAVRYTFEKTPPELAADIVDKGIVLTGGGANLRNLDKLIAAETGMEVTVANEPSDCVALGIGKKTETNLTFDTYVFKRGKRYR